MLELWGLVLLALFLVSLLPPKLMAGVYALLALAFRRKPALKLSCLLWQMRKFITLRSNKGWVNSIVQLGLVFLLAVLGLALLRFGAHAWPLDHEFFHT